MVTQVPVQRVRSTDELKDYFKVSSIRYNKSNNLVFANYGTYSLPNKGYRKAMVDYKPTLSNGLVRQNPMSVRSVRCNATSGKIINYGWSQDKQYHVIDGPACGFYFYDVGIRPTSDLMNVSPATGFSLSEGQNVLQEALAKCNESDFALNEYLLEWKQTLQLLRNPLKTVIDAHRTLRKWFGHDSWIYSPQGRSMPGAVILSFRTRREISIKRASKWLVEEASSRWLQYRYGIMPAVLDITKVLNRLASGDPMHAPIQFKKARHVLSSVSTNITHQRNVDLTTLLFKGKRVDEESYHAHQMFRPVAKVGWAYSVGLHPLQMFNVIWNAIPWSFTVDWLFCVDRWLKAVAFNPYIEFVGNCVTHRISTKYDIELDSSWAASYGPSCQSKLDYYQVGTLYREEARREINLPCSRMLFTTMKWSSVKNLLTGLSLIIQPILNKRS